MSTMETLCINSPVGKLTLFAENAEITALCWGHGAEAPFTTTCKVLLLAEKLLAAYFKSGQSNFSGLALAPHGTPFQNRVWREMSKIKSGKTKSYGQIAKTLKSGPRAVGGACAANPIPLLIPCHRILNADGKIGHYSGGEGQATKAFLLRLEGAID